MILNELAEAWVLLGKNLCGPAITERGLLLGDAACVCVALKLSWNPLVLKNGQDRALLVSKRGPYCTHLP